METNQALVQRAYAAFNARDLPALLETLHPQVRWATAAGSEYLLGRAAVQHFCQQQWPTHYTQDEPTSSQEQAAGRVEVLVRQVVRDAQHNLVSAGAKKHIFLLEEGLIKQFDIENL